MSVSAGPDLPLPSTAASALSARLRAHIAAAIDAGGGSIPFERFMSLALYAPGLGYYSAGAEKLGAAGDFITAPELSPLFGRCVARQVAQVLSAMEGGEVLEFGAGSGRLAVDVLTELERQQQLPECYRILEVSADMRARQRECIEGHAPHLLARVRWLDALPSTPLRGVVLANEVLDAMPAARVRKHDDGTWYALHVTHGKSGYAWRAVPLDAGDPLCMLLMTIEKECGVLPAGYTTEINLQLAPWFQSLVDALARGAVFIIDYGYARREYYHPERREGTLLCHYRHRVHDDPFIHVGLQDITASVDFTTAAEAAQDAGFTVAGYTTQAQFLLALGLTDIITDMNTADPSRQFALAQQARQLTLPGAMGERFKVLALLRDQAIPLQGYAGGDQGHRL